MKPIKHPPLHKIFKAATLYYPDIVKIEAILKQNLGKESYSITIYFSDEPNVPYDCKNLQNIHQIVKRRKIKECKIEGYETTSSLPSSICLLATKRIDLELTADNPTTAIAGTFAQIDALVSPLQRPYRFYGEFLFLPFVFTCCAVFGIVASVESNLFLLILQLISLVGIISGLLAGIYFLHSTDIYKGDIATE